MFYQSAPHIAVESVQKFGLNVVGFQLATGERQWYIVRCYLAPDNTSTIESVVAALKYRPRGAELLVAVYFNAKFLDPESNQRGEDIAAALATEVLEDILVHSLPRRRPWCRDKRMCMMI